MAETSRRDPQTYAIIGAAMEVHGHMGHGFLEAVYQECLAFELQDREISFVREPQVSIRYKQRSLSSSYRPDFLCFGEVVVEVKASAKLTTAEEAQVINYLKATEMTRGLLINFGGQRLEYKRLVFAYHEGSTENPCRERLSEIALKARFDTSLG